MEITTREYTLLFNTITAVIEKLDALTIHAVSFSAVTPISEEVTPKASELCIIGVLLQ